MKKALLFGGAGVTLLAIFLFATYYYEKDQAEKTDFLARKEAKIFVRDYSQTYGNNDAKVVLTEFMDPACETCAAFSPYIKQMINSSNGRMKLVIRYAPFHEGSDTVVKILEAAGRQGKYWQTLNLLFKTQPQWASHHNPQPEKIWQFLPMIGLDVEQIRRDMNDPAIAEVVNQDLADARLLNVRKTPEFFVNGKPLPEFGWEPLVNLVHSELNATYPK